MEFDTSAVDRLAVDLGKAGVKVVAAAGAVLLRSALDIERGMKADFSGHGHAPLIPRAINHTVRGLSAEIGVDKRGPQGGLGNILAFGTSKNAPVVDHTAALQREMPTIQAFLADIGVGALTRADANALVEYTTRSGKTRMATQAQVSHWTRRSQ